MAKVRNPLYSITASGKFGSNVRYARSRGVDRALRNRTGNATSGIQQRRQASVIAENGRLWKTRGGQELDATYQDSVAAVSALNWFFVSKDILLEWDINTLMAAN